MIVKPAPGLKVRHPVTKQFLTDEGLEVPDGDLFWTKVLNDGDVVLVEESEKTQDDAQTSDAQTGEQHAPGVDTEDPGPLAATAQANQEATQ